MRRVRFIMLAVIVFRIVHYPGGRLIRGGKTLSMHSYALVVDINAPAIRWGGRLIELCSSRTPCGQGPSRKKAGSGAGTGKVVDAMHFPKYAQKSAGCVRSVKDKFWLAACVPPARCFW